MTSLRGRSADPYDQKALFFSAARNAGSGSLAAKKPAGEEAPVQGTAPDEETGAGSTSALPGSEVSVLPTLVETHKGSTSEDSSGYAPFSGAEQKVETGTTTDGGVVAGCGLGPTSGIPAPLDMKAFSLNVPAALKDNDEDGKQWSFRGRATSVDADADMRPNLARLDSTSRDVLQSDSLSMRPLSPADTASTLGKGVRLGRMNSFMSASEGHGGRSSVLQMFRKASQSFAVRHPPAGRDMMDQSRLAQSARDSIPNGLHHRRPMNLAARGKLTEEDEAMLSDSEADYDAYDNLSERAHNKLMSPNFPFFRWYATFMLFMLLIFVFYMPVRVAFFPRESGNWSRVDIVWNIVFIADLVVNLNTGFIDDTGVVVYNRHDIFWRYAKGWLIVDLLAAFPFTFLPGLGPHDDDAGFHVAYILSLPKIFRLYELLTVTQENHRLHEGVFLAIRTLLSVVISAHLFGCGWYMLATLQHKECGNLCQDPYVDPVTEIEVLDDDPECFPFDDFDDRSAYIASECPWIYRNDYAELPIGRRYLGSMYWALTTLTTVGYGDLSARTVDEQIYSMAVQIVGVAWYGYTVGTWASVINSFDRRDKEQRSKLREVVAFSKAAALPSDMAKKVRQHFRFALYRQDHWISYNENELVSDMPSALRADVVTFVQRKTIEQIPWLLEGRGKTFVADMVVHLKPCIFTMGETLYREGAQPEELFFITSGRVTLKYKDVRVGHLGPRQMAGLIGIVSFDSHKFTAEVTHKEVHCFGLPRANFLELMDVYPGEMQYLMDEAKSLARRISSGRSELRADLMQNPIVAELVGIVRPRSVNHTYGSPMDFRHTPGGHGSWGQLSVGAEAPAASEERGPLPAGWGALAAAQRPRPPLQQQQQQQAAPRTQSDQGDKTSSEGGGSSVVKSVCTEVTARAGGSEDLGVELMPAFGPPTGVEDAVSRELAARMAGIEDRFAAMVEDRFGAMVERFERRLVDAQNASSANGAATVTVPDSAASEEENSVSRSASEEDSAAL